MPIIHISRECAWTRDKYKTDDHKEDPDIAEFTDHQRNPHSNIMVVEVNVLSRIIDWLLVVGIDNSR